MTYYCHKDLFLLIKKCKKKLYNWEKIWSRHDYVKMWCGKWRITKIELRSNWIQVGLPTGRGISNATYSIGL